MQKLEDYLFDFIGIFIPGFFVTILISITTMLFLYEPNSNQSLFSYLSYGPVLMNSENNFIAFILEQKIIIILAGLIICYLIGTILSAISHELNKKWMKIRKNKSNIIYKENRDLQKIVDEELANRAFINWRDSDDNNKWIVYYRWSTVLSTSKEDRSTLQLLLSKTILIRSLNLSFILNSIYSFLLGLFAMYGGTKLTIPPVGYIITLIVYIFLFMSLAWFLQKDYIRKQKILGNESLLILHKVMNLHGVKSSNSNN